MITPWPIMGMIQREKDNLAERKAIEVLDQIGFSGETAFYTKLVASIAAAIQAERDTFMATNRALRTDWADSPDADAYACALGQKMMAEWLKT